MANQPSLVGVPIPSVGVEFYELTPTTELQSTLRTLAAVLGGFALATTLGGGLIGASASARLVAPLQGVATASASIAAGRMTTRLPETSDPDLAVIVGSFNTMVEALDERMQRDARFAADVAHELRSPVTTLITSIAVLESTADGGTERRAAAIRLVEREVRRLHRSLEQLLELGRLDAGVRQRDAELVDVEDLVRHSLEATMRTHVPPPVGPAGLGVVGDKAQLHRAVVNLLDNADTHGGGVTAVEVCEVGGSVRVRVVDRGSGVPVEERDRVFDRFVRVGSRGSVPGSGLGLSLVSETIKAHGGSVWCEETPGGGATFVLALPGVRPEDREDS